MEKSDITNIVMDGDKVVLCAEIFQEPQRLTPTGKISHAKTRVYTQRYRKEWEQMPDFKGWLTSVPSQATRAFCTYCKKNLHAHRLSLLKHTCTMKHQRAALMYQAEMNEKKHERGDDKTMELDIKYEDPNVQTNKINCTDEDDEDEDESDFDYVERLEMEDEESNEVKNHDNDDGDNIEDDNDQTVNYQLKLDCNENGNDASTPRKKAKLDTNQHRDTLAEAMAHVHGEYFDNVDDNNQNQVLTVESVNRDLSTNNDINTNDNINNNKNSSSKKNNVDKDVNNEDEITEHDIDDKKALVSLKEKLSTIKNSTSNESKLVAYQINPSQLSVASGQQQHGGATLTISPIQNKTIMLSTGKTVTLTTGKLPTGYVLSKMKGNLPTFVMAGGKAINPRPILPKSQTILLSGQTQLELSNDNNVPSTSKSTEQKVGLTKSIPVTPARISTHVIDTSKGVPIGGLQVSLYKLMDGRWTFLNESTTSPSGRCTDLVDMKKSQITAGRYKIHFDVDKYFTLRRIETMYPFIEIVFDVKNPTGNYHIPVLLSPFSYTTYRGADR